LPSGTSDTSEYYHFLHVSPSDWLTSYTTIPLDKLTVAQLVKKCSTFYGYSTVFISLQTLCNILQQDGLHVEQLLTSQITFEFAYHPLSCLILLIQCKCSHHSLLQAMSSQHNLRIAGIIPPHKNAENATSCKISGLSLSLLIAYSFCPLHI
jgi:hypothetical protein